eukprot:scaffold958_cov229-Ochromonas_danica.AAC.19
MSSVGQNSRPGQNSRRPHTVGRPLLSSLVLGRVMNDACNLFRAIKKRQLHFSDRRRPNPLVSRPTGNLYLGSFCY